MKKQLICYIIFHVVILTFTSIIFISNTEVLPIDQNDKIFKTIVTKLQPPAGYKRIQVEKGTFAHYLRNLPLLPDESPVKDYRGNIKKSKKDTTVASVFDYPIKGKKLEQCMDILQRLWAEYLCSQQLSEKIAFYLPGGFLLKWEDWKDGLRPKYHGIKVSLIKNADLDSTRNNFEKYLWEIFYRSNTQTAYFVYPVIEMVKLQIGDFIVKKGKRGHAVLIMDLAIDKFGNKVALIGHGDTPACQFHLLNYKKENPWFPIKQTKNYLPLPIKKKMYWDGLRRFQ
jgi:hypothetical protein